MNLLLIITIIFYLAAIIVWTIAFIFYGKAKYYKGKRDGLREAIDIIRENNKIINKLKQK